MMATVDGDGRGVDGDCVDPSSNDSHGFLRHYATQRRVIIIIIIILIVVVVVVGLLLFVWILYTVAYVLCVLCVCVHRLMGTCLLHRSCVLCVTYKHINT